MREVTGSTPVSSTFFSSILQPSKFFLSTSLILSFYHTISTRVPIIVDAIRKVLKIMLIFSSSRLREPDIKPLASVQEEGQRPH